jgi:hypothetical protein
MDTCATLYAFFPLIGARSAGSCHVNGSGRGQSRRAAKGTQRRARLPDARAAATPAPAGS